MPTYVYGCDVCGHRFEKVQRFSDDPIKVCPECEGRVRRIFQPAGIVFKGSGWHITDYKRAGKADTEGVRADSAKDDSTKVSAANNGAKDSTDKAGAAKESSSKAGSGDAAPASPAT